MDGANPFARSSIPFNKCDAPVVPIHLSGTGNILRKGKVWPKRSSTKVTFGAPIWPGEKGEQQDLLKKIEQAVAELADEENNDWWIAQKRKHSGKLQRCKPPIWEIGERLGASRLN